MHLNEHLNEIKILEVMYIGDISPTVLFSSLVLGFENKQTK